MERVGMISYLAKRFDKKTQFGKTALMKYIYILQEVFNIQLGYEFSLYTYGPYCSDVLADLDYTEAIDGVKIYSVDLGTGGYCIKPSKKTDEYIKKSEDFISQNEERINEIIELFGDMTARDLELRTTIIYLYKNYLQNRWEINRYEISDSVRELKPYFSLEEILNAYNQLEEMNIFAILCN
ncbi:Panacea domain-containing protein [Thermoclostridium stercorarium]|uniref:Panacea domain-containing protein n=1 Tax=Thermoclostridium stercorarium TaxID=1510 RepID=UPI0002EEA0D7|nr:Panacea domain-containing protein [Thermoclostridium stercorarium]